MSQVEKKPKSYWRSYAEKNSTDDFVKFQEREFPEEASVLEDPISRRNFLKLMGASVALAGMTGCSIRKPITKIRPYAQAPAGHTVGKSVYYATSLQVGEDVVGVLAETQEGRPTKLEGNPSHASSRGALSAQHQAAVLNLYDTDRIQQPTFRQKASSIDAFDNWLSTEKSDWAKNGGKGLSLLMQEEKSPSFYSALSAFEKAYPKATIYKYEPVNTDNRRAGLQDATGQSLVPAYQFDKADVILSLDADFLGVEPNALVHAADFAKRRDPDVKAHMNRLYVIEGRYSLTGSNADHRYRVKPNHVEPVAWQVMSQLLSHFGNGSISAKLARTIHKAAVIYRDVLPAKVVKAIAEDLISRRRKSLVVAGASQPASIHTLAYLMNQLLSNNGRTVSYRPLAFQEYAVNRESSLESVKQLATDIAKDRVETLVVLGGDPAFTAPADLGLSDLLQKVKKSVVLADRANETSKNALWVLSESHALESWGDLRASDGTVSIVQPVIQPLYESLSKLELVHRLVGTPKASDDLVKAYWQRQNGRQGFASEWKKWLHTGLVKGSASTVYTTPKLAESFLADFSKYTLSHKRQNAGLTVSFVPSASIFDGRFANNGWLQELPDPITKLTWDNAALMSRKTAQSLGVSFYDTLDNKLVEHEGDLIELFVDNDNVAVPVMVVPGHADDSITLTLGYGQASGSIAQGVGFNTYPLRTSKGLYTVSGVSVKKTGETYKLATTQNHGSMEGRPIIREASLSEYEHNPNFANEMVYVPHQKSLWEERPFDKGYQWGMSIDLAKCTGCNACITACQSENNIPIVGKERVLEGREMHWIRIDRYFEGDEDPAVLTQPVTCLQCENAPCEQVCPVAATVHSEEGLNDMVYNRCIGTRYCSNNCPVKVRRFNFFDYHQRDPQSVDKDRVHLFDYVKTPNEQRQKQFNPEVTVRMRGVMEKCTYCVQRISEAKSVARVEDRSVEDGDIMTACQQTCPSNAIVFGNVNDPNSKVSLLKKKQRNYQLLEDLHLKARTTYLAIIKNPNPVLVTESAIKKPNHHESDHGEKSTERSTHHG